MKVLTIELFMYHQPNSEQIEQMKKIRIKARELAFLIDTTPMLEGYRDDVIKGLHHVTMTANAGIILLPFEKE